MDKIVEHLRLEVKNLQNVFNLDVNSMTAIYPKEIKNAAGVYSFWWIGDKSALINANREIGIVGPKISLENTIYITWDWNIEQDVIPLYIGKSTNIDSRIRQHLMLGTKSWYDRDEKMRTLKKKTTACQFRSGFEHLFKNESLQTRKKLLAENIGFSYYIIDGKNSFVDRFYIEDYLIGYLRPWFNLDSER